MTIRRHGGKARRKTEVEDRWFISIVHVEWTPRGGIAVYIHWQPLPTARNVT